MQQTSANLVITTILLNAGLIVGAGLQTKVEAFTNKESLQLPTSPQEVLIQKELTITKNNIKSLIELNNPEIQIMKSKIDQAKFDLKSELSAWYPSLDISGSGLPQYLEGSNDNNSSADTTSKQWKANLSATVRWYLINPARIPDIEAAKDKLENTQISYEIKLRDLYLKGLKQFFQLQKSNQEVRIAKDSILTSETSLKEAEIRLDAGIGTKFEVLEAQTQLSKDKQFLSKKSGESKINQRKLAKILNLNSATNPIITSKPEIIGLWDSSLEESIIAAYSFQKELEKLIIKVSINNNQANSALAAVQPKLSIFNTYATSFSKGELGVADPDTGNEVFSESNTIGLQFDWKIFDGGYGKSVYESRKEKTKELEFEIELEKDKIREEVEESFFNLEIAKQNIANTYNEIISAKESLRLALLRLKAGITTQREVVTNQRDLTQAEVNYIIAITDYNSNLVNLRRETGIQKLKGCNKITDTKESQGNSNVVKSIVINSEKMTSPCIELL